MEAVFFGFALGAGTVVAARHGRRFARRAIGWTAKKAGWVSGHVATALEDARRVARDEFERGRRQEDAHVVEGSLSSSANGTSPPMDDEEAMRSIPPRNIAKHEG